MGGLVSRGACLGAGLLASVLAGPALAQEAVDWSGFYAGVFAGYGLDTAPATASNPAPITLEVNPGEFITSGTTGYDERFETLFGGVQAGYNRQFDGLVLGVEGAITVGGFDKSRGETFTHNGVLGADYANLTHDRRTDISQDWLSTFVGKAGVDFDGWLVYGEAGLAVANISAVSVSAFTLDTNLAGIPVPTGTYSSSAASSALRIGPVIGIGVEKRLTGNLSLGLEYNFVHLGDFDVTTPDNAVADMFVGGGAGGIETFSANTHSIKGALNYHF